MSALEQAQLDHKLGTSHTKAGRSGALRAKLGILFCGRSVGGESKCYRSGRELNIDPRNGRIELAVFGVTPMEMGVAFIARAARSTRWRKRALHSATAAKGRRLLN
jgi:hypothetical protein